MNISLVKNIGIVVIMGMFLTGCQSQPAVQTAPTQNGNPNVPYINGPSSPPGVKGPTAPFGSNGTVSSGQESAPQVMTEQINKKFSLN